MHGLLAVSALHYAYVHPHQRREYNLISAHYQNLMLPYFATRLHDINDDNCEAYFFLASMIFLLSLCWIAHHETLERNIGPSDVAQSFLFLQGVKGILDFKSIPEWRQSGPLAPLLRSHSLAPQQGPAQSNFLSRLDKITVFARQIAPTLEIVNPQTACILALESLRVTYSSCKNSDDEASALWMWPIGLPDVFIEMLRKGHPTALIILAHYAALARPYQQQSWVSREWSSAVMTVVERNLDRELHTWIDWPKRSIRGRIEVDDMEG